MSGDDIWSAGSRVQKGVSLNTRQKHVRDTIMPSFRHTSRSRFCLPGGYGRISALEQLGFCSYAGFTGIVKLRSTPAKIRTTWDILCRTHNPTGDLMPRCSFDCPHPTLSVSDHLSDLPSRALYSHRTRLYLHHGASIKAPARLGVQSNVHA